MTYLLDANACIAILNDRKSAVARNAAKLARHEIALSHIVKAELYYGAFKSSRRGNNLKLLRKFFQQFSTLSFDNRAAETYGRIRADLASAGTPIGPNDLIIAATAVRHGATLVTHNTDEFGRVEGLQLVDWA